MLRFVIIVASQNCKAFEYFNCQSGNSGNDRKCNLGGVYSPRQWKKTLNEAKAYCKAHSDCRGITRDNGGYEPRKGPSASFHVAAHELWLCKGINIRQIHCANGRIHLIINMRICYLYLTLHNKNVFFRM